MKSTDQFQALWQQLEKYEGRERPSSPTAPSPQLSAHSSWPTAAQCGRQVAVWRAGRRVAGRSHYGGQVPYIVRMWEYALARADDSMIRRLVNLDEDGRQRTDDGGQSSSANKERLVTPYREEGGRTKNEAQRTISIDAIPYVPAEVEDLLGELTEESSVLDLGCLGGYGLYDFACRRKERGVPVPRLIGVDIDSDSIRIANEMAELWKGNADIQFVSADATSVPLPDGTCDLVIARLLLPYVSLRETIDEVNRVLKPSGRVLFQAHGYSYYWKRVCRRSGAPRTAGYFLRAILSGVVFDLSRRQLRHRWFRETALTRRSLVRLCSKSGLDMEWTGGNGDRPLSLFLKRLERKATTCSQENVNSRLRTKLRQAGKDKRC